MNNQELINYLLNYDLEYRDKVTFSEEITFGTEMEVVTRNLFKPVRFCDYMVDFRMRNRKNPSDYVIAIENYDDAVTGGELISPILTNTEGNWEYLQHAIADFIQYTGDAQITYHTSGHVHLGHDLLKEGDLVKLVKLYAAYEPIIFRFAAGEFLNVRAGATSYARPIAQLVQNSSFVSDEEVIETLCYIDGWPKNFPFKYNGLNLSNLISGNDTLEFRVPNGTLKPVIWQNNVNFFAHLIMALDNFDEELIDYYIKNLSLPRGDRAIIKQYNQIWDFEKALELANTVFEDEKDKLYFLRQYIKDGNMASSEIVEGYQLEKSKTFVR